MSVLPPEPFYACHGFSFQEDVPVVTNPPTLVWLFAPLARLAPATAFGAWVAVQGICLVAILRFTRELLGNQFSARGWRLVYAATIYSAAVYWQFFYAQWHLLLAAGYVSLKLGDYRIHTETPPALRMWTTSPLLGVGSLRLKELRDAA